jgi:hypothetical protein
MMRANEPFQFIAASYMVRICRERANNLAELAAELRTVSDASIFYHTFQSLEEHHYTPFSSEFAQWVVAACNQYTLAEQMAALDVGRFVSIDQLRRELVAVIEEYLEQYPQARLARGFEPFYFCEEIEFTLPLETRATTLAELADGIRNLSLQSLHHHFINSRLRLRLRTNDFSHWIQRNFGLTDLADRLNHVDFHTNTLDNLRDELVATLEPWINQ